MVRVSVGGALVCALLTSAAFVPALMRHWYEKIVQVEYCSACGAMRETVTERWTPFTADKSQSRTASTCISDTFGPCESHTWSLCARFAYDWGGANTEDTIANSGMLRICVRPIRGSLRELAAAVPDLTTMISRDLLHNTAGMASIAEWCLRSMAEDSNDGKVRRWLARWRELRPTDGDDAGRAAR